MDWKKERRRDIVAGLICIAFASTGIITMFLIEPWEWGTPIPWLLVPGEIFTFILGFWILKQGLSLNPSSTNQPDAPLVDAFIYEEGTEAEEISHCEKILEPDEKLLMIISGGESKQERLALTDRRVIIYHRDRIQRGISLDHEKIDKVEKKQRRFLTWLADIHLSVSERTVKFEKADPEMADEIVKMLYKMKQKAYEAGQHIEAAPSTIPAPHPRSTPPPPPPPPSVTRPVKMCHVCGSNCTWIEQYSRWYCYTCSEYR